MEHTPKTHLENSNSLKTGGFLKWIEHVGNKMPHPMALFLYIILFTIIISYIFSLLEISAIHPTSQEKIQVTNLFSISTLVNLFVNFTNNIQTFPIIAPVLLLSAVTGLCEKTGFFINLVKVALKNVSGNTVVFVIALTSCIANLAVDTSFLIMPIVASTIFYGLKRNPIAGMFLGYATACGGFATNLLPTVVDVFLTPITNDSARLMDPNFSTNILSGYFMMATGVFCISAMSTFITIKYIEPSLGVYTGTPEGIDSSTEHITKEEEQAVKKALLSVLAFIIIMIALCIPLNSVFRSPTGSLVQNAPLMLSVGTFVALLFFIPGIVYGYSTKQIKNIGDIASFISQGISQVSGFFTLAIVIAQFLYLFKLSNLGAIIAIKGSELLINIQAPTMIILILYILFVAFINLFILSGVTKYLIFAPIFVPMLMQLNIHPAFTQMLSRFGDGMTNNLTPLNPFFPLLLALAQKYDKKIQMGTLFSAMIPYSIGFFFVYGILTIVWVTFQLPPGIDSSVFLK